VGAGPVALRRACAVQVRHRAPRGADRPGDQSVTRNAIADLTRVTRDSELALSSLVGRIVERRSFDAPTQAILAAERSIVATRFRGNRGAYLAALRRSRATVAVARAVIADELRRRALRLRLRVPTAAVSQLEELVGTYGAVLAREVEVDPAPAWLPGGRGLALATQAPARVFTLPTGATARIRTLAGVVRVRPLEDAVPLAAVPFSTARPALARLLREAAQENAYRTWTTRAQNSAFDEIRCIRDRLPAVGAVELTSFLPYLSLGEGTRAEGASS